jgi:putative tricarboxylic transport membrane protein
MLFVNPAIRRSAARIAGQLCGSPLEDCTVFKRDDWMFGILAIVIGAVALIAVAPLAGVKTMDPAGPTAFPKIIAWMMIAIGVLHIIGSLTVRKAEDGKKKVKKQLPVILICVVSILYYLLLMPVGYPIMTPLLVAGVMLSVGERRLGKVIPIAIGAAAVLFVVFYYGLGVSLPLGVLEPLFYY